MGTIWYSKSRKDSAFHYLEKGYKLASENKYYKGMLMSLNSSILYRTKTKDYSLVSALIPEALDYRDKTDDPKLLVMLYNNLAIYYKATGRSDQALEYYHMALLLCEEQNDKSSIGLISSNMGLLYEQQDKTDLALEYLNKSLAIRRELNNKLGESYVRTNLGLVYENLKKYEIALDHYHKSLDLKEQTGSSKGMAILYNNIGIIHRKLGQLDSARYYCTQSLAMRIKLNDKLGEARTRTTLGQIHLLRNEFKAAEKELSKALDLAGNFKSYPVLQNIHASLYKVYAEQDDHKNANFHLIKFNAFKDSIFNIQKERSIAGIEAKYDLLKQEKENLFLTRENELKDARLEKMVTTGVTLVVALALFTVLLIFAYRSRSKLAEQKTKIENQTDQLSKAYEKLKKLSDFKETMTNMLVHDLKNPLNLIVNYKSMKGIKSIDDMVQQSGYSMQNLVHNILDVYKYQDTKLELSKQPIPISRILNDSYEEVAFLAKGKNLDFVFETNSEYTIDADMELLKRVFVNLFTNAITYTPSGERISISCEEKANKVLHIQVTNPGPGIPTDKQKLIFEYFKQAEDNNVNTGSSGLGLSFCKLAVEGHGGKIGVISEASNGVTFWFTLPGIKEKKELQSPSNLFYKEENTTT